MVGSDNMETFFLCDNTHSQDISWLEVYNLETFFLCDNTHSQDISWLEVTTWKLCFV